MKKIYIKPVSKVILLKRMPQLLFTSATTDMDDATLEYYGGYDGQGR